MKKILIIGKNSYIGKKLIEYIKENKLPYEIDTMSVREDLVNQMDFSPYDTIIHLAALVHQKEKNHTREEFIKINSAIPAAYARKAKVEKVRHYIYFSSMEVFDDITGPISSNQTPRPKTFYGISKLEGENLLIKLKDDNFTVTIVRPPMVYGQDSPGTYTKAMNFVKKAHFFPDYENIRSFISIENLCEIVSKMIENTKSGTYHIQDPEKISTTELIIKEAEKYQLKLNPTKLLNPLITLGLKLKIKWITNLFADKYYEE